MRLFPPSAWTPANSRRFGEGDLAGVRRGLHQVGIITVLYSALLVAPVVLLFGPPLAGWLAEAPLTIEYTKVTLFFVPLSCLLGAPFLVIRPVFEAMGRGRPGLALATLRYGLMTAPAVWLGMRVALSMGQPGLYGMIVGLLIVGAITSAIFMVWLRTAFDAMDGQAAAGAPASSGA